MKRALALTGPQLAELAGVSLPTWNVHKKKGAPTPKNKRDLKTWVERYAKWRVENLTPGRGPGKATSTGDSQELERWRQIRADIAQLDLEERRGELVKREEVIDAIATAIVEMKKRLGDARKKLSPRLYQSPSVEWIDDQLGAEFDAILTSYAHGLSDGFKRRETAASPVHSAGSSAGEGGGAAAPDDGEPMG